ncbi:peptide chain release factor N(5)-glutamine methyltransferase [Undibacterium flavidum]|uniref:Release factor glutamine methyltransferase n=1 Tax=Undibacterium flavidum TaxID=2762297 RepID=A0ABR6Y7L1_9BURK|nr:peptide chain release factor N(5)-glutamine methyltransferase [Undibacterium flavidum]MBC3872596.1 peptide chain release factor N(5)-glutamine methyltransferase [Undibacterium flavidum]
MSTWFSLGDSIATCQKKSPLDALETRMLIAHVAGLSRVQLITRSEDELSTSQIQTLNELIAKRLAGEPIAYLLGEREFYGLNFKVSPAVLIPRADTELLVELALQYTPPDGSLLDMGTGSGAIAISIAVHAPTLRVSACDISIDALAIAQSNTERLLPSLPSMPSLPSAPSSERAPIQFYCSDWYQAIPPQSFHTIVSNPPYIVQNDPHLSQGDLRFEPINALTDHADGLSAYRIIIDGAPNYLIEGGYLLLEHGYDQSDAVQDLLRRAGFTEVQSWPDLAGILRVSGGRLNHNITKNKDR